MIREASHAAADVLRRCQMPAQEIRSVLATDDPAIVHMLFELHAERLREELAERLTALSELEGSLTGRWIASSLTDDFARQGP